MKKFKKWVGQSLSKQINVANSAMLFAIFFLLILIVAIQTNRMIYNDQIHSAQERAAQLQSTLDAILIRVENESGAMSKDFRITQGLSSGNVELINKALNEGSQLESFFENMFIVGMDGKISASTMLPQSIGAEVTSFPLWKEIKENGKDLYIDELPYASPVSGNPVIVVSSGIKDISGNLSGIFCIAVDLKKLGEEYVHQYKIGKTGYFYVVNQKKEITIHPNKDLLLKSKAEWTWHDQMINDNKESGSLNYKFDNKDKSLAYAKMKTVPWFVGATMYKSDLTSIATKITWIIILIAIIAFILFILIMAFLVRKQIIAPFIRIVGGMGKIASYDFTLVAKNDLLSREDEIGLIAHSYEKVRANMHSLIKQLSDNILTLTNESRQMNQVAMNLNKNARNMSAQSQMVSASSEEITANTSTIAAAAEQASASVSTVAAATEEMSSNIHTVASAVEQTGANILSVSSEIINMAGNMQNAEQSVNGLVNEINSVVTAIDEMNSTLTEISKNTQMASNISIKASEEARQTNELMKMMEKSANEIGKIVKMINDIADQTNMLALNATIEAASAGEAGKGFAVVANEVKELAKQTSEATGRISHQIEEVQKSTQTTAQSILKITDIVSNITQINTTIASSIEEQSITTNEIASSVNRIANSAEGVGRQAKESAVYAKNIQRNIEEATKAVNEISMNTAQSANAANEVAKSSEEANHGVQDIARNTQEITMGIQEVNNNIMKMISDIENTSKEADLTNQASQKLIVLAEELQKLVDLFKLIK